MTSSDEPSVNLETYRLFMAGEFLGTEAAVSIPGGPLDAGVMQRLASEVAKPAACFAWPVTDDEHCFEVHCFNPHQEIACCGHGLLAVAEALKQRKPQELLAGSSSIPVKYGESMSVGLPRVQTQVTDILPWMRDCVGGAVVAAAEGGGDHAYLILELPEDVPLAEQVFSVKDLGEYTQRALIVTQWLGNTECDYQLRYFAPQYGVMEDRVTGSAQRVLADYWFKRKAQTVFSVIQRSESGGTMRVELDNNRVYISRNIS